MEEDRIIDLGKIGLTFDPDAWDAEKPYEKYTVIMHEGRGWVSLVDNINSEPAEGSEVWMMISDSGESLYEMMVRTGRYSGTEEQFLQDYEDAVAAAVSAANNANQAAQSVGDAVAAAAVATQNAEAATREANDAAASVTNHTLGVDFNANTGLLKAIYGSHGSILDVELNQETGQIVVTEQID